MAGPGDEQARDEHGVPEEPGEPEQSTTDQDAERLAVSLSVGIGIGMALGAGLGVLLGNVSLGISIGLALAALSALANVGRGR